MNHWIRPSCDSRTGASHLRRGAPCQDASGIHGFRDAAGSPIQVLVVSDGHGGARYVRSDIGARLACTVAMRELQQALAPALVTHPGALEEWRAWLSEELPGRIVDAWRREVEAHWRSDPCVDGSQFSPLLYGATLGVLLLTPAWWAHTGVGDWDLVRIEADGGEALLSEEPEQEARGEATFSLCLEQVERQFAARTVLRPLTADQAPFGLLLCSDGLRKSCGSDGDFLTLCRYLLGLCAAAEAASGAAGSVELAEALDHISRQGSGDDISVAAARWAPARQGAAWPQAGGKALMWLVQPTSGRSSAATHPSDTMAVSRSATMATATASDEPAFPAKADKTRPLVAAPSHRGRRRSGRGQMLFAAGMALVSGALLVAAGRGLRPFAVRPKPMFLVLTPQQRSDLSGLVQDLCKDPSGQPSAQDRAGGLHPPGTASVPLRDPAGAGARPPAPSSAAAPDGAPSSRADSGTALPATRSVATVPRATTAPALDPQRHERITATLAARDSVFRRLRDGDPAQVTALLANSHVDPLSALIAASASGAGLGPAPSPADPPGALQRLGRRLAALVPWVEPPRRSVTASPLSQLAACPELRQALQVRWQSQKSGVAPSRGLPPAASSAGPPAPAPALRGKEAALRGALPVPAASSR